MRSDAADRPIADFLSDLGFRGPRSTARARAVLEEAGLTNPRKVNLSAAKLERARRSLFERLAPFCGAPECRAAIAAASPVAELLPADRAHCLGCSGSPNRRDVSHMARAMGAAGWTRLVIVGGSPATREELRSRVVAPIELRLVSGTDRRTAQQARTDRTWAQIIVIWGATELDHKVSALYTSSGPGSFRLILVRRRSISALAQEVADAAAR